MRARLCLSSTSETCDFRQAQTGQTTDLLTDIIDLKPTDILDFKQTTWNESVNIYFCMYGNI
jgi:hypothetical protein